MILFCATEAGGARELIPVAKEAVRQKTTFCALVSRVSDPLFKEANIPAQLTTIASHEEAKAVLQEMRPTGLVIGTTGVIGPERYLTAAARECGVRSVTVLDEWYNYALRFRDASGDIGTYLPDAVCVQDELSKELAEAEGIPASRMHITGSPALSELSGIARAFYSHPPPRPTLLQNEKTCLLFLSEKLKAAYGDREGTKGTHGSFLGFHEEMVRADLADILTTIGTPVCVLEKLHPAETRKDSPAHGANIEWHVLLGPEPLLPLLWHSRSIVGMCSKTLLEAVILGKQPISYQPNARHPEKCTAVRLGLVPCFATKKELQAALQAPAEAKRMIPTLSSADPKAAKKVLALLRGGC